MNSGLQTDTNGVSRCWWCGDDAEYQRYHDEEWGFVGGGDRRLFEKICLEGFQSGLSWLTILRKREGFRDAFDDFDIDVVAAYDESDVARLLADERIVRHRGKIEATINNAQRAKELLTEFPTLAAYFWSFEPPFAERPEKIERGAIPGSTPTSKALSKDLKKRGWKFVGPTTAYAFLQSVGIVNDHVKGCFAREHATASRVKFWQENR